MASKTFNVAVVGYGMSAKIFHIPFITLIPQFKLYSVVQRSPKPGNSVIEDHPGVKHYRNTNDLLADPAVDVVVITTPPDNHFELTKAVLESGKHVLTEKPFVPTSKEADDLVNISRKSQRLICVFQNRRWDSDFLTVKHLVENQVLGRVVEIHTHFDRYKAQAPATWKGELGIAQGGSVVFDLGTHLTDQIYTLFGKPKSVYGKLTSQRRATPDFINPDSFSAELTYADGMVVYIKASALSVETQQPRFWVRGVKGSFHKVGLDVQEDQLKAGMKPNEAGFGKDSPESIRMATVDVDGTIKEARVPDLTPETYLTFYSAFAKALETGNETDIPVKASEAADVLRILEAVMNSAKSGKDIVLE